MKTKAKINKRKIAKIIYFYLGGVYWPHSKLEKDHVVNLAAEEILKLISPIPIKKRK